MQPVACNIRYWWRFTAPPKAWKAGYTTQVVQGSHGGGFADVELKRAIDQGLVQGPRLLPAGPILAITAPGTNAYPLDFKPFEPEIVKNGPEALRAGVRELGHYVAPTTSRSTPPVPFISSAMAKW